MNQRFVEFFKRYDFSFIGSMSAIFLVGILNLYSATHSQSQEGLDALYKSQLMWFVFSLSVAVAISFLNPKTFERFSYVTYVLTLFLVFLVMLMGKVGMGAQRWLVLGPIRMQPSEFMKMGLVLALARFFTKVNPERELGFKELIFPGIIVMVPAIMVILQPDLGTGMLLLFIFSMMMPTWSSKKVIIAAYVESGYLFGA